MSNDPSSNPYQSPSGDAYQSSGDRGGSPAQPRESIDYMGAYTKFFEHPDWVNGLLLASLAAIIPFIGGLVVIGYEYDNIARTLTGRGERPYSQFTFERFGEYLMRAVWLFLYSLCWSIAIVPVMLVCMLLMGGLASLGNDILGIIGAVLGSALYFVAILFFNFAMMPGMLRVVLTNDISQGFDFGFIFDFIRKMWVEQILVILFITFSSAIVMGIGILVCCIGMLPAMVITWFAMTQLMMQLYQVYLYRGGQPIQIAP